MEKKSRYWKVEVDTFDDGTVKAAVIGNKLADKEPRYQRRETPGMVAEIYWFEDKGNADFFVKVKITDRDP
jgi:hypothetical protein